MNLLKFGKYYPDEASCISNFKEYRKPRQGDRFDFTIPYTEAYGEYNDEHVITLPKSIFEVDGHFDSEAIAEGKIVPLLNADGQHLNGVVAEVRSDCVIMDMNHPLAGADL
ncbi:hypothetical protein EZS27_030433, partial [termite gut metagenome]